MDNRLQTSLIHDTRASSCIDLNKINRWINGLSCGFVKSVVCLFCQSALRALWKQCLPTRHMAKDITVANLIDSWETVAVKLLTCSQLKLRLISEQYN